MRGVSADREIRHLSRPFQIKSVDEEKGTIAGYGSVFGVEDWYSDIVMPGAFKRTLKERGLPKMLWQHSSREPLGIWTEAREDEKGLWLEGQLAMKTQRGQDAYELLKMGALDGLSIGFSTKVAEYDDKKHIRKLLDVELFEVSPVTFPANEEALVEEVRAVLDNPKNFERQLRDALGLTRDQAKALMAGGWKALSRDAEEADREQVPLRDAGVRSLRDAADGEDARSFAADELAKRMFHYMRRE